MILLKEKATQCPYSRVSLVIFSECMSHCKAPQTNMPSQKIYVIQWYC